MEVENSYADQKPLMTYDEMSMERSKSFVKALQVFSYFFFFNLFYFLLSDLFFWSAPSKEMAVPISYHFRLVFVITAFTFVEFRANLISWRRRAKTEYRLLKLTSFYFFYFNFKLLFLFRFVPYFVRKYFVCFLFFTSLIFFHI